MVFAVAAAIWLVTLGFRGLYNPDEGRYAEISREILAGGDWVIPHLDALVYIEKPPLQYGATAISEALFGQNDWRRASTPDFAPWPRCMPSWR